MSNGVGRVEPARGGGALRVVDAAFHWEQVNPALLTGLCEEHDSLGKAARVPEPIAVEHRAVNEDTPGSVTRQADLEFEMRCPAGDLLDDSA